MCEWGNTVPVLVWVPDRASHKAHGYWKHAEVDECIAPIVEALNGAGIATVTSCCGHGKGPGKIDLEDGRVLVVSMAAITTCCQMTSEDDG